MCFISTVLPEPEPPEDDAGRALLDVEVDAGQHLVAPPKDFHRSWTAIIGGFVVGAHQWKRSPMK